VASTSLLARASGVSTAQLNPEKDMCCVCKRSDPDVLYLDMGFKLLSGGNVIITDIGFT